MPRTQQSAHKRKERDNDEGETKGDNTKSAKDGKTAKDAPTLDPDKFTIHLVRLKANNSDKEINDDDEEEEIVATTVRQRILKDFPALLPHMKRGDAVENLDAGGYRSQGTYFVEAVDADAGSLTMIDRSFDLDEYGSQPLHFTCLGDGGFAPDYFNPEKAQTNDMYCPGEEATLYWHTDNGWSLFSKAMTDQIAVDPEQSHKGTLQHDGVTYTFLGLPEGKLDDGMLVTCEYNAGTKTFTTGFC